jgi:glc operon protein GlcG
LSTYRTTYAISHGTALRAVSAAFEEGGRQAIAVTVSVVDPSGTLIAFGKSDGSAPDSEVVSRRKAQAAVAANQPSGWIPDEIAVTLPLASGNFLTSLPGGFPIRFDGHLVGALGISGGHPSDDAAIAAAVLASIGAEEV